MKLTILSPGPLTTVQDEGRFGYMNTGFSPGGAMDRGAMRLANLLVGNKMNEGVLEMTMAGITAAFSCDTVIAVTGADMSPLLNGKNVAMNESILVKKGDELKLGFANGGLRTYLAVAGGFDLPLVMGSLSTNLKCCLGGFQGRKLAAGDEIPLKKSISSFQKRSFSPPKQSSTLHIHAMLGPQEDYFTDGGIHSFFTEEYTVSPQSDRMGIRLEGVAVESKNGVDIISDGIAFGSVQIPAAGTPIIMMADRQTTGGYAKIATVISSDLDLLAQAKPGDKIRFHCVAAKMAVLQKKAELLRWKRLEKAFPPSFGKE